MLLLVAVLGPASSKSDDALTINAPQELDKKSGYLLVDLNLERDIGIVVIGSATRLSSSRRNVTKPFIKLGPLSAGRHLYLLSLPEGEYSWSEISVPHYDLPHRVDSSEDSGWRFRVMAGQINYAGQILISKERSSSKVSIALLNRIAYTLDELRAAYAIPFDRYQLHYAGLTRDLFVEEILVSVNPKR
jgi:hypothetical protein